ncbi:MAG: AAA family ATPase [Alphaproteobacteria bacterium]
MAQAPDFIRDQVSSILDGGNNYYDVKAYEYLLNFMRNTDRNAPAAYNFCYGLEMYADIEGFPVNPEIKKKKKNEEGEKQRRYEHQKKPQRGKVKESDWTFLQHYFEEKIAEIGNEDIHPPIVVENFLKLADYLGFSDVDKTALEYLIVHGCHDYLDNVASALCNKDESVGPVIARMCNDEAHHKQFSRFISPNGKLIQYGLMERPHMEYFPELSDEVGETLAQPNLEKKDIVEAFVGVPTETELDLEDFEYMGQEDIGLICDLVKNALAENIKGVNILVYGPAGGGKTELSRAISKALDISMYAIGEEDNKSQATESVNYDEYSNVTSVERKGGAPQTTGQKRLADLLRAQSLLKGGTSAFLLFDEIEDLLLKGTDSEKAADTESKIAINRLLENNPVPVIWNGNDPEKFHQAVRDRFTFSLYVDHPPMAVRKKIWEKQINLQGVDLPESDVDYLAREYDASPRKITLALKAAKVSGRGRAAIEMALPASAKITHGSSLAIKDYSSTSRFYNPALSTIKNAKGEDFSTPALIQQGNEGKPFALLASGALGTGLRSLTRHIAEGLNMNIDEHSMDALMQSDMMSSAETKIASAFNAAADRRRFLAIHDVHLLAGSPADVNSWDVGLTGLLTDLARHHDKPFALTSTEAGVEFPDYLAEVFSDRVTLNPLTKEGRHEAFETFFGQKAPGRIDQLDGLVISDFANVRHNLKKRDTSQIYGLDVLHMLAKQIDIRTKKQETRMGFRKPEKSRNFGLPPLPEGPCMVMYPAIGDTMPT